MNDMPCGVVFTHNENWMLETAQGTVTITVEWAPTTTQIVGKLTVLLRAILDDLQGPHAGKEPS